MMIMVMSLGMLENLRNFPSIFSLSIFSICLAVTLYAAMLLAGKMVKAASFCTLEFLQTIQSMKCSSAGFRKRAVAMALALLYTYHYKNSRSRPEGLCNAVGRSSFV